MSAAPPQSSSSSSETAPAPSCGVCFKELDRDHPFIRCAQGHHLCEEDSQTFLDVCHGAGWNPFPPRCSFCKLALNLQVVERNLKKDKHIESFTSMAMMYSVALGPNEIWVECPFCPFKEIRTEQPLFFFCKAESCKKMCCATCGHLISNDDCTKAQADGADKVFLDPTEFEVAKHFKCQEYSGIKQMLSTAVANSITRPCPSCGLRGLKDDGCTHITCDNCQKEWCYVCSKPVDQLDKAPEKPGEPSRAIFRHNTAFQGNRNRCPMYMEQIHDVDHDWPEDSLQALLYFHRILALRELKAVLTKVGEAQVLEAVKLFPGVLGGYTVAEVKEFDTVKPLYKLNPDLDYV